MVELPITTWALQHLGHFLLTNLLLPKLRQTSNDKDHPSRVITVSSSLYHTAQRQKIVFVDGKKTVSLEPGLDLDDLQCERNRYTLFGQYAQSKACNIMFAQELGRREKERCLEDQRVMREQCTLVLKNRKKLRPSLTPLETAAEVDGADHSEVVGLGFDDIVTPTGNQQ